MPKAFKIPEAAIKDTLEAAYTGRKNQAGFKRGNGCRDQIFAIRQILEPREEFKRNSILIFIDFKAAFDSINQQYIWNKCEEPGMEKRLLEILKCIYTETNSQVKVYSSMSDQPQTFSGVRQGSVLSSLFNLAIDHAMETVLDGETFGITLHDMLVTDLDNADDICLLEDCPVKAQKTLDLMTTKAAEVERSINVPKTKFCSHDSMIQLQRNGEPLEAVQEFIYLGTKTQVDGNITSEVKTRIAKAAGSFKILSNL